MRIIKADALTTLEIARVGEQEATQVRFGTAWWYQTFGAGGSFALEVQRPTDAAPYLVPLTDLGDAVAWTVSATDAAILGRGSCQLRYLRGDTLAKARIWTLRILASLSEPGEEPPEPFESYVDAVHADAVAAETAQAAAEFAQGKAEDAQEAAEDAQTAAETAQGKAEDAQAAAETAQGKAEDAQAAAETAQAAAEAWATGGSSGTPSATNNAQYYAEQAAQSAGAAAVSKDTAAAWATGGTTGTPGAENNAQYYAGQAAGSAAAAADSAAAAQASAELVAAPFDAAHAYAAGDLCLREGALYVFTVDHTGPWSAADVEETTVDAELKKARELALGAYPTEEASGAIAHTDAGAADLPLKKLVVQIKARQAGSGDPSPENVREISGWTGTNVYVAAEYDPEAEAAAYADWSDDLTCFGGTLDALAGKLSNNAAFLTLDGSQSMSIDTTRSTDDTIVAWILVDGLAHIGDYSDMSDYSHAIVASTMPTVAGPAQSTNNYKAEIDAVDISVTGYRQSVSGNNNFLYFSFNRLSFPSITDAASATAWFEAHPTQVVFRVRTPEIVDITPLQLFSLLGDNSLWAECGNVDVTFRLDPTLALDQLRSAILALGNNT